MFVWKTCNRLSQIRLFAKKQISLSSTPKGEETEKEKGIKLCMRTNIVLAGFS